MKTIFLCILLLVGIHANEVDVTPVQKVLHLLEGMLEKGKEEKHNEQVLFAKSKSFCESSELKQEMSIKTEKQDISGLQALIEKDSATAEHLLKLIGTLDEHSDEWSGDIKAATKVRDIEKDDYDKTHQDYTESIEALRHAIDVLKDQAHDRKSVASLAQVSSLKSLSLIPEAAKKKIDLFFAQDDDDEGSLLAMDDPAANAYEFQSQGINDMLAKLLDKFIDERTTIEKEEANSKHAYTMLMQDLKAQILQAVDDKHGKELRRTKALGSKASESSDLKEEAVLLETDEKALKELEAACSMEATDFESRQELRTGEIEAIEKAIEIISSDAISGNSEKHLASLAQQKKATSFTQLRSDVNAKTPGYTLRLGVSQFLETQAAKLNSRVLSVIATRAEQDPTDKVKRMIKDLVVRLMEEANEEADHKGWCDTELGSNKQTRQHKSEAVETLHSEVDELEASIAKITDAVTELSQAVADLDSSMAEKTELRNTEKAKNEETINDSQEAQTAVAQALTVLKEFYSKAASATSFVQKLEPYKGMQSESTGIVGMLEVVESDFARLESSTKAAEATAQKEYDDFMDDAKVDKAQKSTTQEHKAAKKQDQMQALTEKKSDLEGTQKELDAALSYFEKLKPSCVDAGVSYEDRVARRKEEIESLQNALQILNGEDISGEA